ncbi:L,D-transpeptidase family protein [Brucella tritici]|uniref:Murein L,D-transpeptidase n=1 Tax=Brucella tritici TaxID=94626 RepID=A0A6L3YUS0_9HYPH|nr:murein L,D-transpeptidase family protein [Brucella tritici]KAB2688455.1 murein L,D-transpeptidase [Brucella tritici]
MDFKLIERRALLRTLMGSVTLLGAAALSGCQTDFLPDVATKANAPIPPKLLAEIRKKNMAVGSPILLRVFKVEAELEVWKQDRKGRFALLKTYPICKWSGDLGPKIAEGDRQTPEGFYDIRPGQMNPDSEYYLSFNLGFPNAFDRAHGRTGTHLMVHGDCSSQGCYAMTDAQILEIFALGREAFKGGQRSFQVQAYPFRMTPANLARYRDSPHMAFWRMLKEGNDHFEVTRRQPKVDVCDKRYVFNAFAPGGGTTPMNFDPLDACPAYEVPKDIAQEVRKKQHRDDREFDQLVAQGVETAPIKSGRDGGMHSFWVDKLRPREIVDEHGNLKLVVEAMK